MTPTLALFHRLLAGLLLAGLALGACARDVRVPLGTRGAVLFTVPDAWRDAIEQSAADDPPTVTFAPPAGRAFQVLITPMWPGIANAPMISPGALREEVRHAADAAQPRATERELKIVDFTGPAGYGAYFSATDREVEPDGYLHLTQGMLAASDLRVTFTILANGDPAPVVQQALTALRTLRREPAKGR
jgi:hypothetical protein